MTTTAFKTLHSFPVTVDQEVTEREEREENGQKVTVERKVTKPVTHTIVMKEPSRSERKNLALHQTVMYNEAITLGLLPKALMQRKLSTNAAGPLSADEDTKLAEMESKLIEMANDYMRLSALPQTDDLKTQKDKTLTEWAALRKRVEDLNTAYQSVYAHTAESYMQNKTLMWLNLFLTYIQRGDKPEILFEGADFAAKEERAGEMEDTGDPIYKALTDGNKLSLYWSLYLFGRASSHDDFVRIEDEWKKQMEAAAKMKAEVKEEPVAS